MNAVFLQVIRMSVSAAGMILAAFLLRAVFQKAPAYIRGVLWMLVAFRLICPVTIPLPYSPLAEGERFVRTVLQAVPGNGASAVLEPQPDLREAGQRAACAVWLAGLAGMAVYGIASYLLLMRKMRTAVPVEAEEGIFLTEVAEAPFVMGMVRPRIYLPFGLTEVARDHVLLHERLHVRHRDYLTKVLFYGILCIHWFNPAVWAAWQCFGRDLELICDESAARQLDGRGRREYAQTLFECSMSQQKGPLLRSAFGGVDIRKRVEKMLSYQKPGKAEKVLSLICCLAAAVCFLPWETDAGLA